MKRNNKLREKLWAYILAFSLIATNLTFALNPLGVYAEEKQSTEAVETENTEATDMIVESVDKVTEFITGEVTNPDYLSDGETVDGIINYDDFQGKVVNPSVKKILKTKVPRAALAPEWVKKLITPDNIPGGY